ncbi:MAG: GGDEF domain-containing protein [Hydrogenothermaceae bacterium]
MVIHKVKLYEAINTNPLTGLPGNMKIKEYIDKNLMKDVDLVLIYFDFDNFKPFNDKYGFRVGDRVIQLFSNIITSTLLNKNYFVGHIGGDDFFAAKTNYNLDEVISDVKHVVESFKKQVVSFYDKEDISNGYMVSKDRDGNLKHFKLMSVSAAILCIDKKFLKISKHNLHISEILADLKKSAKVSGISLACII